MMNGDLGHHSKFALMAANAREIASSSHNRIF